MSKRERVWYCLALFVSGSSLAHVRRDLDTHAWVWVGIDLAAGLYLLWWSSPLWREPKTPPPEATITVTLNGVPRTYELAREVMSRMERDLR